MLLRIALIAFGFRFVKADGFVEEVSCAADGFTIMLNRSDPDIVRWVTDKAAQPVVYIYGHKNVRPCGSSMKNDKGDLNYNLTINYGKECDVYLSDLEPNYRTAETTIALEDNEDNTHMKITRINHVFCLYTRTVQTIRYSDVSTGHEVVASKGGKPKPRVEMLFRSTDGSPLRAAKFGDTVEFYVALSPDQAYHGIAPKECMFSDREDMLAPEAQHITFVQNSCPVSGISEIIDPLANVNQEVYFSKFKTFRFGNQSTVFAHCTVQVCLDQEECNQKCFKRIHNSNLTADRLRFRHRREVTYSKEDLMDEINISKTLTILTDEESKEVTGRSIEQCLVANAVAPQYMIVTVAVLAALVLISTGLATYFGLKLRKGRKDSFELYASSYATSLNSVAIPTTSFSQPHLVPTHHYGYR